MRHTLASLAATLLCVPLLLACGDNDTDGEAIPYEQLSLLRAECLAMTDSLRATEGKSPLKRWLDAESCSDTQAASDQYRESPHGNFGSCGEKAQNTCPGWPLPDSDNGTRVLRSCLAAMWAEGPGEPYSKHGHYLNMSSSDFGQLACGFSIQDGSLWINMNFQ